MQKHPFCSECVCEGCKDISNCDVCDLCIRPVKDEFECFTGERKRED